MQSREERNAAKRKYYHANKKAIRARQNTYRKNNADKIKKIQREYMQRPEVRERKRAYDKKRNLMLKYGMDLQEYESMMKQQKGKCKICGKKHQNERAKWLVVDHDHSNGKVRSLLCDRCNTVLGLVEENKSLLFSMIGYLNY